MSWEQAVQWLRAQPEHLQLVKDCYYDDPLLEAARRYHSSSEWRALQRLLPVEPGKVLELGAGRGIVSYALAMEGWDVTALEPDPGELVGVGAIRALSRDSKTQIRVVQQVAEHLPFADASFDLVITRAVLHHANDLEQLCREASRVLKKGGYMLALREHVISRQDDLPVFLQLHPLHRLYGGEKAYLLQSYLEAMRRSGFCIRKLLNPFQSDINLYPETTTTMRMRIANRLHMPVWMVPQWTLTMLGHFNQSPGRLYTFVGVKT